MLSFLKWYLSFSKKQKNYKAKVNLLRAKEIKEKKIDKKVDKKKGGKGWEETDEKKKYNEEQLSDWLNYTRKT